MASAWGASWGSAWGDSWGKTSVTPPPSGGMVGGGIGRKLHPQHPNWSPDGFSYEGRRQRVRIALRPGADATPEHSILSVHYGPGYAPVPQPERAPLPPIKPAIWKRHVARPRGIIREPDAIPAPIIDRPAVGRISSPAANSALLALLIAIAEEL